MQNATVTATAIAGWLETGEVWVAFCWLPSEDRQSKHAFTAPIQACVTVEDKDRMDVVVVAGPKSQRSFE